MIAPDVQNNKGKNKYMGTAAYEPTYNNNAEWCLIETKDQAITALQNGKAAGGKTWKKENIEKAFSLAIDAISQPKILAYNLDYMSIAKAGVRGFTDFLAYTPQPTTVKFIPPKELITGWPWKHYYETTVIAPAINDGGWFEREPTGKNNCFVFRHSKNTKANIYGYDKDAAETPASIQSLLGTK